jgi:hypothetical protein
LVGQVEQQVLPRRDLGRLRQPARARAGRTGGKGQGQQDSHQVSIKVQQRKESGKGRVGPRATSQHQLFTTHLSSGSWPWKKWPAPGTTVTGSTCGRAQSTCLQRHHLVGFAVHHQAVLRHGAAR